MDKPNILILMPDQLRADSLGCAAHPVVQTPHMDCLAAEGMRFTEATTVSPICMPARASFVSGLYPHNHGMWTNRGQLPAADETFFQHLQRAGYRTAHIGKSHFYEHAHGLHLREREPYMHARGIDDVHETTGRIPPATVTRTLAEITDVFPTLLEAAGCDPSRRCLGRSLWPVLRDPAAELRDFQLSEIEYGERKIMLRSRDFKYVIDEQGRGFILYDLGQDPDEQNNIILSGDGGKRETAMRDALLRRLVEAQYSL